MITASQSLQKNLNLFIQGNLGQLKMEDPGLHQSLKNNFYALSAEDLIDLGNTAHQAAKNPSNHKTGLYKVFLSCYALAYLKESDAQKKTDVINKIIELQNDLAADGIIFNARLTEPYSPELSNIERQIALDSFVAHDHEMLAKFAEFYFRLAFYVGVKPGKLEKNLDINERLQFFDTNNSIQNISQTLDTTDTKGNDIYLMKAVSYYNMAATVADDPILKLHYKLVKIGIITSTQMEFYRLKNQAEDVARFKNWYERISALQERLNSFSLDDVDIEVKLQFTIKAYKELKSEIKSIKYDAVNSVLNKAEDRENSIVKTLLNLDKNTREEEVIPTAKSKVQLTNSQHIKLLNNKITHKQDGINDYCEYQLRLDEQYTKEMNALKKAEQIEVSVSDDIVLKFGDALKQINSSIALAEFFITFKQSLMQNWLGSSAAATNKFEMQAGALGQIGNLLGEINLTASVVGKVLGEIDNEMILLENKHISSFASSPKEFDQIISWAAITLALTYKNEINTLSIKPSTEKSTFKKLITIPPGAVSFAAFAASYALADIASNMPKLTTPIKDKVDQLVNAVMNHKASAVKSKLSNKVSKSTFLSNLLGSKAGVVQQIDGKRIDHLELLARKTQALEIAPQESKEDLSIKVESLVKTILSLRIDLETSQLQSETLKDENQKKTKEIIKLKTETRLLNEANKQLEEKYASLEKSFDVKFQSLQRQYNQLSTDLFNQQQASKTQTVIPPQQAQPSYNQPAQIHPSPQAQVYQSSPPSAPPQESDYQVNQTAPVHMSHTLQPTYTNQPTHTVANQYLNNQQSHQQLIQQQQVPQNTYPSQQQNQIHQQHMQQQTTHSWPSQHPMHQYQQQQGQMQQQHQVQQNPHSWQQQQPFHQQQQLQQNTHHWQQQLHDQVQQQFQGQHNSGQQQQGQPNPYWQQNQGQSNSPWQQQQLMHNQSAPSNTTAVQGQGSTQKLPHPYHPTSYPNLTQQDSNTQSQILHHASLASYQQQNQSPWANNGSGLFAAKPNAVSPQNVVYKNQNPEYTSPTPGYGGKH